MEVGGAVHQTSTGPRNDRRLSDHAVADGPGGTFPRPVRITERNRGYLLEAVEAWMKARIDGTVREGECGSTSVCGLQVELAPPGDRRRLADMRPPVLHVTRSAGGL